MASFVLNSLNSGSIGVVAGYRDTRARDERAGVKTIEFVSSQAPLKRPDLDTDEGNACCLEGATEVEL